MAVAGTLEYLISVDSSKMSKGMSDAENKVKNLGSKVSAATVAVGQVMGNLATKAASATVGFVKDSIEESMSFDKAMSQVAATMGKSVEDIQELSDFAREMGGSTAFSATQAAEALNYMALAGYDADTSMKMLPTVLNLAAAGNMELASASDMVTDAQSALGLSLEETETMVDQMAKTSSKTNTSVSQLGEAFLTIGGTARNLSGGTQELSALLGVLADNGIKGAEGGTKLRNVILSLTAPTDKAAEAISGLGVAVFDEEGNMRSLPDIIQDINTATSEMTQAERTSVFNEIFNKQDLKAVEALLNTDVSRWKELYGEIGEAEGAAEQMAATQLDNLSGDMTIFQSAMSEAKLTLTKGLTPALRTFVQSGTQLVTRLTNAFKSDGLNGVIKEAKSIAWEFVDTLANSDSPIVSAIGRVIKAFETGFTWENMGTAITAAWEGVKAGVESLGKIVFGERVDGSVDWPDWEDVKDAATKAWEGIKKGALGLAGLVFGRKEDGSVDWPTWQDVEQKANEIWNDIKAKALDLAGLVFGKAEDGTVAWPDINKLSADFDAWWKNTALPALQKGMVWYLQLFGVPQEDAESIATIVGDWWSTIVQDVQKTLVWFLKLPTFSAHEAGEQLRQIISDWWKGIVTTLQDLLGWLLGPPSLEDSDGSQTKSKIQQWWEQYIKPALKYLLDFTLGLFGLPDMEEMKQAILDWWEDVKKLVGSLILRIKTNLQVAGDNTFDEHYDAPDTWTGSDTEGYSNAKGNWNVPYDNYHALLHRGERVLTSSQARQDKGESSGVDTSAIASAVSEAIRSAMDGIGFYFDKTQVAAAITDQVSRNIANGVTAWRY